MLVQNFRPGVVERLGIDEAAIRAVAPGIVYVSINGFGEKGPYAQQARLRPDRAGLLGPDHGAGRLRSSSARASSAPCCPTS